MGSVTMENLSNDLNFISVERWEKLKDVEVVPRRMVEMILEQIDKNINFLFEHSTIEERKIGAVAELSCLESYINNLLKAFEED